MENEEGDDIFQADVPVSMFLMSNTLSELEKVDEDDLNSDDLANVMNRRQQKGKGHRGPDKASRARKKCKLCKSATCPGRGGTKWCTGAGSIGRESFEAD